MKILRTFLMLASVSLTAGCSRFGNGGIFQDVTPPRYSSKDQTTWASAKRDGRTITVLPCKATFEIPKGWVDWHKEFGNNFHLTRKQLHEVALANSEMHAEFASFCNLVFPFDRCAVQVGDDGWGKDSVGGSTQLRVYDVTESPMEIQTNFIKKSIEELKRITGKPSIQAGKDYEANRKDWKGWRVAQFTFERLYGDCFVQGNLDCYSKRLGERTIVLLFMHRGGDRENETMREIVDSFKMPPD